MRKIINVIAIFLILIATSCAHKSGHKERRHVSYANSARTQTSRTNIDTQVEIRDKKGNKMDGAEIFRKFNKAVFMVYTSDGTNTYQGSGFFINSNGLAVSNYHVFKGTGIGQEAIKLSGSDNIYKVVEVIKSSEAEDFIVFRVDVSNTDFIPVAKYEAIGCSLRETF